VLLVCTVYSVLYSEIALSRKPFGIGHMHIYTFLLRMTDTMTSRNIDLTAGEPTMDCDAGCSDDVPTFPSNASQ
jgi:hypothetical protein